MDSPGKTGANKGCLVYRATPSNQKIGLSLFRRTDFRSGHR